MFSLSIEENPFSLITKILKYLTVNIVSAIKKEMSQCLYLQVIEISFSEIYFVKSLGLVLGLSKGLG